MSRIKKNTELLKLMNDYNLFMSSKKQTMMPLVVNKEKPNHKSSLYAEQTLLSDSAFGDTIFDCEIRSMAPLNYSFQIISDKINSRVLARLDEGNGVHRNNLPHIPLAQQQITTPHIHKYDASGFFIAYKSDALNAYNGKTLDIKEGLRLFCDEEKIESLNGDTIAIQVQEDGKLPLEHDKDPLNGIVF